MGVIVAFNFDDWLQLFPQFNYLNEPQAALYFNLATQLHRNDGGGPVCDPTLQLNLLNLVTAHLVQLMAPKPDGTNADGSVVGRITNASEGSVSAAFEMPNQPQSAAWWQQTQFGATYWQATAQFRTMRYSPAWPRVVDPWPWPGGFGPSPGGWFPW
jgi:hypothetical protein